MSNIPYHAWTHRPKAQGGTDPIARSDTHPFFEGDGTQAANPDYDATVPLIDSAYTSDATVFGFDVGEGAVEILIPGVYFIGAKVSFEIPWDADTGPDVNVEVGITTAPGAPVDEGGHTANFWKWNYELPSFGAPADGEELRWVQLATFLQMHHAHTAGNLMLPYVRASAGTGEWPFVARLHLTYLGPPGNPVGGWTFFV